MKKAQTPYEFGGKGYLGFEHVTVVPIQKNLVKQELLTMEEVDWLNDYHQECWTKVSPLLLQESLELNWLFKETRPL